MVLAQVRVETRLEITQIKSNRRLKSSENLVPGRGLTGALTLRLMASGAGNHMGEARAAMHAAERVGGKFATTLRAANEICVHGCPASCSSGELRGTFSDCALQARYVSR